MPKTANVVHYGETPPPGKPIIYFFGPCDFRSEPNWHLEGVEYFNEVGLHCAVCLPTPRDGVWRDEDAAAQTAWQFACQDEPDAVGLFWVPRLAPMTFVEFGAWCEKVRQGRKAVLGLPDDVPRTGGLIDYAREYGVPRTRTLPDTLETARSYLVTGT